MSKDFDGDYADIVVKVIEAGMDDVRRYLDWQQKEINEARIENQSLMEENNRLHAWNETLNKHLEEERKRLKPDGPLMTKDAMLLAVHVLRDADIISWMDIEDWIEMIELIERKYEHTNRSYVP
jgi:chromosome segregation ATPase